MNKPFVSILSLVLLAVAIAAQSVAPIVYSSAPIKLPDVTIEMKTPGFWISQHPSPDSLILSPEEIIAANKRIKEKQKSVIDILQLPRAVDGNEIGSIYSDLIRSHVQKTLYTTEGKMPGSSYWQRMRTAMQMGSLPAKIQVQYGILVRFSDQRVFPTEEPFFNTAGDVEFDQLQNSGYDLGTVHALYTYSADGKWVYARSGASSGWFRTSDIAICTFEELNSYLSNKSMIVVSAAKADIWLDRDQRVFGGFARMGSRFPLFIPPTPYKPGSGSLPPKDGYHQIKIPLRTKSGTAQFVDAYISKTNTSIGFLPYTPRNVLIQAFKFLGSNYGWGDMNGDWDCSSLLKGLFSVFGFDFPRNGGEQENGGSELYKFSIEDEPETRKKLIIDKAIAGISLLRLDGHIMLYIGRVGHEPYVLHTTWGYRVPVDQKEDMVMVINNAVVSDLDLGAGTKKKSLIERLTKVIVVK